MPYLNSCRKESVVLACPESLDTGAAGYVLKHSAPAELLTSRQREALQLIAEGVSVKEAAVSPQFRPYQLQTLPSFSSTRTSSEAVGMS